MCVREGCTLVIERERQTQRDTELLTGEIYHTLGFDMQRIGGLGGELPHGLQDSPLQFRLLRFGPVAAEGVFNPLVPVWPRSRFVRGGFGLSVAVRVALAQLPACRKLGKDVCLRLLSRDEP